MNEHESPAKKPGVQTSEFWLTAASLAASVLHSLGITAGVAGDVKTTVSGAALALVACWLGGHYMAGRLQLKAGPSLTDSLQDAFAARLATEAARIETEIRSRFAGPAGGADDANQTTANSLSPQSTE